MSDAWKKKLKEAYDSEMFLYDTENLITSHLPKVFAVCAYRGDTREKLRYGILCHVDLIIEEEDTVYVHFLGENGLVEEFMYNMCERTSYCDSVFFSDMDENLHVIKQCDNLIDAAQCLNDVKKDGKALLQEI